MSAIQSADRPSVRSSVVDPGLPTEQPFDPFAIANFLRQHNPYSNMSITVWRHGCVCILLEAEQAPHQAETIAWLRQCLSQSLHLSQPLLKQIRVYARQTGQNLPIWYDDLDLAESAIAVSNSFSLLNWLHQGVNETALPIATAVNLEAVNSEAVNLKVATQQTRFLRFYLTSQETALLPLDAIQEVLRVSVDNILPIPDTPDHVLGVYNHRGEILWLVDLRQQLGFSEVDEQFITTQTVIVIQHNAVSLGAVVARVSDIELHDLEDLHSASADLFPLPLRSFLQGYLLQPHSFVLDAKALITQIASS